MGEDHRKRDRHTGSTKRPAGAELNPRCPKRLLSAFKSSVPSVAGGEQDAPDTLVQDASGVDSELCSRSILRVRCRIRQADRIKRTEMNTRRNTKNGDADV